MKIILKPYHILKKEVVDEAGKTNSKRIGVIRICPTSSYELG